jgi:PAS domain S-box-containing protein
MHPGSAETELFKLCSPSSELIEALRHALERAGCALPEGELGHELARARPALGALRTGDWAPIEQHLEQLAVRHGRAGVAVSAWYAAAAAVSRVVTERAIARHASDPARLTELLGVLGDHVERMTAAIVRGYYVIKEQREREVMRRHDRLIEAAPDAVIEIDERGAVTEFTSVAERMFGYRKADAIGRPIDELIIPERFRDQHRRGLARLVETGDARLLGRRVELTAMHADGSELPVELALVVAERLDGKRCFIGWLRDLRSRQQLEESLALRAHALEQAQFGIVVSDPTTRHITNVNPAYAALTGYTLDELIGSAGERLFAPGTLVEMAVVADALRQRGHLTYRARLQRKDGGTVPVMVASSTVVTPSGATMRVSTVIDISEPEKAEQARAAAQRELERTAARLEILSSTSHEFASVPGDVDALLALVTRRLVEIIGEGCAVRLISRSGAWLEPTTHVHHPDPELREFARALVGRERTRVGDGLIGGVAASGTAALIPAVDIDEIAARTPPVFRPLLANFGISSVMVIPIRSRGRTLGVISLIRPRGAAAYAVEDQRLAQDLADRAGLAIDNALLVATLEQRVGERTAALEAANRDLEAFSYSVSHDLRTPLRAIDGFSMALIEDYQPQLDETAQRYLQRIRTGAQRMGGLIDDLLALARVSRVSLNLVALDLSALASDIIAEIRRRDPARATPVHIAPGLSARGDSRLLRIALENLLGNAWKYTARHPGAEVWVGSEDSTFYVRDTGAGFDMTYAGKLFEPFQRLHADGVYEGTGIGLAIVARIISHHGGRIWATGDVDKGATFFFTLGVTSAAAADLSSPGLALR